MGEWKDGVFKNVIGSVNLNTEQVKEIENLVSVNIIGCRIRKISKEFRERE